ncbi:MAG: cytochrome b/b6 domain-containing protein [Chloroflexi bacterium]|nr:cytochrome b/b6 domain-containing protein [Chloroflexota bacterium]
MKKPKIKKAAPKAPTTIKRYIYYRDAVNAVKRLRVAEDGTQYVVRFSLRQRIEHLVLIFSFTTLAITGLSQSFYTSALGNFVLTLLGGIDSTRQVHHIAAFVFGIQSLYHVAVFIDDAFVHRHISKMFPAWSDVTDAIQMIKFNLGLALHQPRFDRYNFEEKAEYWALVWGTIAMGITGIMQWFPAKLTMILPAGWIIPVGRALHRWEAILAVLAILTWHFYHSVIKALNLSIFNGNMSIEQMREEHPLELAYLQQAAAAIHNKLWPVEIEIPLGYLPDEEPVMAGEEIAMKKNAEGSTQ